MDTPDPEVCYWVASYATTGAVFVREGARVPLLYDRREAAIAVSRAHVGEFWHAIAVPVSKIAQLVDDVRKGHALSYVLPAPTYAAPAVHLGPAAVVTSAGEGPPPPEVTLYDLGNSPPGPPNPPIPPKHNPVG